MISNSSPNIYVSDLDRAVAFYRDTLGLEVTWHQPGKWAGIATAGGGSLGLHPSGPNSPKPGQSGSISVGFLVDEPIDKAVQTLQSRGVQFRGPVMDDTAVRLAFFGDPDGNDLYLCEMKWGGKPASH